MIESWRYEPINRSETPTFVTCGNGITLVYVAGHDRPMTPDEFQIWAFSQMVKQAAGRPSVHIL